MDFDRREESVAVANKRDSDESVSIQVIPKWIKKRVEKGRG